MASNTGFSSVEEENDMLLYMWQRAAFIDSGQGIPREKADSLRLRIAQLSSYHTKMRQAGRDSFGTEQLLKDYMCQYSQVMDERNESKGMNNLCSTVDTLLAGKVRGQRNWKSSLQASAVKEMPAFKALLKEADSYAKNQPTLKRDIPPYGAPTPSSSPVPANASSSHPATSTPQSGTDLETASSSHRVPQRRGTFQYSETRPTLSETRDSSSDLFSMAGQSSSSRQSLGDVDGGVDRPPMKRCRSDKGGDGVEGMDEGRGADLEKHASQAFGTAKEEYARQQQRRYGGGGGGGASGFTPGNYGSSKKMLGTRRGASSRFVPPIRRDPEDMDGRNSYSSEAEIRSRVLRGGEGGRGGATSGLPPELEGNEKLRNIEPRMVEMIMNEIMDHSAPVQWEDIAGLEFAKATIKEIVVWPMMRPDLFTGLRGPPKGILLFGPPGTGKTLIGKCIASQVAATFFSISASSLTSKWIGEGEKMVRALFAVARCFQPAVIFMDEIDSLLTQRSDTEHESSRRIKTEFLVQLDGATTSESDRLLVIGATNRPQEIDEAARRRLVKRLYIPLPDTPARKHIVLNLMKQQPYHLADNELDLICNRTEGFSGADMASLCREAAYGPVREAASTIQHISAEDMRKVLFRDFEKALLVIKPSVSERDLDLYIEWNRQFGCGK